MLENIHIVLVQTSHPGNIGAAARAMKTMGITRLSLVAPEASLDATAYAMAAGAQDILADAMVFKELKEALQSCSFVIGTSARTRSLKWPMIKPVNCARLVLEHAVASSVAIVFGPEDHGLSNRDLQLCHAQVVIPANPQYSSLNLAAAVQIITYEIYAHASIESVSLVQSDPLGTNQEMESYYQHLQQALITIGYLDPQRPRQLMARLRRLFNRAQLTKTELDILRGILKQLALQEKLKKQ